jgi:hypothetical protein
LTDGCLLIELANAIMVVDAASFERLGCFTKCHAGSKPQKVGHEGECWYVLASLVAF